MQQLNICDVPLDLDIKRNAVVLASDKRMFPAAAFNAARLATLNNRVDTDIILATDWAEGIASAQSPGGKIKLLYTNFSQIASDIETNPKNRLAIYYRMAAPRLLQKTYKRIIWLDVDTYIYSDRLFNLFDLELGDHFIAAVRSVRLNFGRDSNEIRKARRQDAWPVHFNSGVLLYDVGGYLKSGVEHRLWNAVSANSPSPIWNDETVLNLILDGKWLELSPSFNMNFRYSHTEIADVFPPVVLHFMGPLKAWSTPFPLPDHPARVELAAFLQGTPWQDFFELGKNRTATHRQTIRQIGRKLGLPLKNKFRSKSLLDSGIDIDKLDAYLSRTDFADVAQGLTKPRLDST